MSIPSENEMPRFIKDMCEPLFDIIRGLHLDQKKLVLGAYWQSADDMIDDEPEEYEGMTTTDLALESFLWNICINQRSEGAPENNSLKLFMEVAHQVWRIAPLDMPNTQGVNA
tara:strand:- start:4942 stop:5280 length:339 start_codon:yes stop_codon:yes gene_type:complete